MVEIKAHYDKVFDAQVHFRILLDAMAHPGKLFSFEEIEIERIPGIPNGVFYIAFALLNSDVRFAFLGESSLSATEMITQNTSSLKGNPELVDFVFFSGNMEASFIQDCKKGNLSYPEEGASLVVYLDKLSTQFLSGSLEIILTGPGIEKENRVYLQGLNIKTLEMLKEINSEFPLGLDIYLVDQNDQFIAIPRSAVLTFKNV